MKNKNIIFDLDGTLINPSVAICRSVNYALEKRGYPEQEFSKIEPYIGRHLLDVFRDFTDIENEKTLWEMIHLYRERYEDVGIKENNLLPGIKEMIQTLEANIYIASVKPWPACKMILKEFGLLDKFSGVYGAEIDGTRADKFALLAYLKEIEDIDHAVMVGDRDIDVLAAKTCGFKSIGVTYGYGSKEEIENTKPDLIVDDPRKLKRGIASLCSQ